jgi:predicted permease
MYRHLHHQAHCSTIQAACEHAHAIFSVGAEGQAMQVTVFEAAMPPMIGASIVAMDHELDPPLLTLMIGVGIPLSFLTLPAWWYLLTLV